MIQALLSHYSECEKSFYSNTVCLQYLLTKYMIVTIPASAYNKATVIIYECSNYTIDVNKFILQAKFWTRYNMFTEIVTEFISITFHHIFVSEIFCYATYI